MIRSSGLSVRIFCQWMSGGRSRSASHDSLLNEVGCLAHLAGSQIFDDRSCLLIGGLPTLLRMNGLEQVAHFADLCRRNVAEDIAIEMHHAALPLCLG
jgi:hypothetical protein